MIFDIIYLITHGRQWPTLSYWLVPVGVLVGLTAALFGFLDWTKIPPGTRANKVGMVHGLGNVVVVTLFALSWFLRGSPVAEPPGIAIVLSLAGGGLSLITGWLGGELVDRLGVGVDDGANLDALSSLSGRPATQQVGRTGR